MDAACGVARLIRRPNCKWLFARAICGGRGMIEPHRRNGVRMDIATTRFGRLEVNEERIISFPNGLLGFPDHKRFALIQTGEENYFFWLQSVDEPNLAFVVTDPAIFFKGYEVPLRDETRQDLRLEQATDAGEGEQAAGEETAGARTFLQVFVICN